MCLRCSIEFAKLPILMEILFIREMAGRSGGIDLATASQTAFRIMLRGLKDLTSGYEGDQIILDLYVNTEGGLQKNSSTTPI